MKRDTAEAILLATLIVASCSQPVRDDSAPSTIDESSTTNVWHMAKHRGVSFRAIGQEPAWLLEITSGSGIFLSTDYGQTENKYEYTDPEVDAENRRTRYVTGGGDVGILIEETDCTDVMSGERFAVTVTVTLQNKRLSGCGRTLQ